ncbi:MAG: hypothetical protein CMQ29_11235 [Gammaproteobacteria bacterium]|nr:hypothetical protein [Gammaproteobacteria bacterium]
MLTPVESYFAAAHIDAIPANIREPRHPVFAADKLAADRKLTDLASSVWLSAETDLLRLANLNALNDDAFGTAGTLRKILEGILSSSAARLPTTEIEHALGKIGVLPADNSFLSAEEKAALDRDGYVSFPDLLSAKELVAINARFDAAVAKEGATSGYEVSQTQGISRLSGSVLKQINHDGLLDVFFVHPRLLAATRHVLGPHFKMSSSNFHCPLPGYGHQGIHADWGWSVRTPQVVNAIWMLDDFTLENGPTRVVPGSHLRGHPSGTALSAAGRTPADPVPGETSLTGKAGTCVVYNAHLWHGGTQNFSLALRRSLHSYFTRAERPTQTATVDVIDPLVHKRLNRVQRAILDLPTWSEGK